jgi:hypothetical protein
MKVVYIIGPYRGSNHWVVECNVRRAEELALEVAHLGAMPLCPHTNTRHFEGLLTDSFWLDGTMELARRSDAAICVKGWEKSVGSCAEVKDFLARGAPVFGHSIDLQVWLEAEAERGKGRA